MQTLISADDLSRRLAGRDDIRVLDVRWQLGGPPGLAEYRSGHIPGAVYVDLDTELAGHGSPEDGRHPLPAIADLQSAARRWGLHDGDTVVVYDDLGSQSAARAWWLLRHAGMRDVLLLDGALAAWRSAGLPVAGGDETPPVPGTVHLGYGALGTIDADTAAAVARTGVLLDARAGARYSGETEPIDPRAGHIPGAISAPTSDNLTPDGRFRSAEELRERFEALGVTAMRPVGVYCGSGITAAHEAAALGIAGFVPYLYPGSWSQWSNLPDRPVETGEVPAKG
ncbi:thiosulfate/3-mercaptopyruvate sulfurtransferase [Cryobacterium sp. MP_M5]|uniref:sulfurtransferase n=1 Tax=unclassified Cryobacterium TaxID=2649013 RepID=UPI0018CA030D|nr:MULTISPECIES: sulfurtransferase [unclassified Cryobacterium]MBG6058859.1 thiosulfate/3-mercaptopyruvate sulfurtransferase [Cryobacterium sp. MP_M3]MEC5177132.1 thiosulfate/3-mercaptopyruvate sulfurtransferase [Cryobacterium sp. MP_M5]